MSVLKTLFDFRSGELDRIPYLLYSLLSLATMVFTGSAFIALIHETGALMVVMGLLLALSTYVTFSLAVKRVRHIGLNHPIGLVLSFFVFMAFALFVMPDVSGQGLSSIGGVEVTIVYAAFLLWGVPGSFLEKKPLNVMFCDAKTGSLRRLPFFGYMLFVGVFLPFLMYLIVLPFQMIMLYSNLAIVGILAAFVLFSTGLAYGVIGFYSNAVLTIKRMRNIGFKRPILYFWLYIAFFFVSVAALVVYAVTTIDFSALQTANDISPLVPLLITGGVFYLIMIVIGLFLLFAPEGTLNSPKKLEK